MRLDRTKPSGQTILSGYTGKWSTRVGLAKSSKRAEQIKQAGEIGWAKKARVCRQTSRTRLSISRELDEPNIDFRGYFIIMKIIPCKIPIK